jgi:hypothetical protein
MQAMLRGIPGLTVNWTMIPLGHSGSLASHAEYRAFDAASTKDKDSNPNFMVRVDVKAPDGLPRRRGPAVGNRRPRQSLAALDSLLNAIGTTALGALQGFHTLANSAAKTTASRALGRPPPTWHGCTFNAPCRVGPLRLSGQPAVPRAIKMRHVVLDLRIEVCEAGPGGLALPEFHLVRLSVFRLTV